MSEPSLSDLADAVECMEEHFDALGDALVAELLVLVRATKAGTVDRASCRFTAKTLLRHVAHAVDLREAVPLVRLLGTLAALPDGDERMSRALSPVPTPGQPLEEAIAARLAGHGSLVEVRQAFADATITVPVLGLGTERGTITIRLIPLMGRDGPMVAVFSSVERFEEYRQAAQVGVVPHIEVAGWEVPELCPPDHGVMVNPGSILGCTLRLGPTGS